MTQTIASVIIFIIVFVVIMSDKVHRAVAATAGAVILFLTGILTVESCIQYIDFNTIGVLVGMMLFVAVVKRSGIFEYIAVRSARISKGNPWYIMMTYMVFTAVLSAFLDNVTTVLLISPMTLSITRILKLDPVPFFMTQIFASNIGGTATLIGDPPNIMIGSRAGLTFMDFVKVDAPVNVIILIATIIGFYFIYRRRLAVEPGAMQEIMQWNEKEAIKDLALIRKSAVMSVLVIVGFILHGSLHLEPAVIALTAASVMMLIGRQNAEAIIADVEWPTLIFFIGLFIVIGGMVETGVIDWMAHMLIGFTQGNTVTAMLIILWFSAVFSSILDNIPFVATMIPLILTMGEAGMNITPLWWALSLGACLGGNGTLIGASANVVLAGISGRNGHPITFMNYLKVGYPVMVVSIAIATAYLLILYA